MFFNTLFNNIDDLICHYLGLDHEDTKVHRLHRVAQTLMVSQTGGFKRHAIKTSWADFSTLEAANLEQFGRQAGQALAQQLVISFKEPTIRINLHG